MTTENSMENKGYASISKNTSRVVRPPTFADRSINVNVPITKGRERQEEIPTKHFSTPHWARTFAEAISAHRKPDDSSFHEDENPHASDISAPDDRISAHSSSPGTHILAHKPHVASPPTEETSVLAEPVIRRIPPPPDFFSGPYVNADRSGSVFMEEIYDELSENMDDRVLELYSVCVGIATILTMSQENLDSTGYWINIIDLGKDDVEEIRLSCYRIAYKLLTGNWQWETLCEEAFLVDAIKTNLRRAQRMRRFNICSDTMLDLGFTDEFLYK
jgi:hypothetical protein